jgi:hypothetical protein
MHAFGAIGSRTLRSLRMHRIESHRFASDNNADRPLNMAAGPRLLA